MIFFLQYSLIYVEENKMKYHTVSRNYILNLLKLLSLLFTKKFLMSNKVYLVYLQCNLSFEVIKQTKVSYMERASIL